MSPKNKCHKLQICRERIIVTLRHHFKKGKKMSIDSNVRQVKYMNGAAGKWVFKRYIITVISLGR